MFLIFIGCQSPTRMSDNVEPSEGRVESDVSTSETDSISTSPEIPTATGGQGDEPENSEAAHPNDSKAPEPGNLVYEGSVTDEISGISQDYRLVIKPDFSAASIGGGPFTRLEDQGDGSYMWLEGAIIGMSIRPTRDRCIVMGSEGDYFCTLHRR